MENSALFPSFLYRGQKWTNLTTLARTANLGKGGLETSKEAGSDLAQSMSPLPRVLLPKNGFERASQFSAIISTNAIANIPLHLHLSG